MDKSPHTSIKTLLFFFLFVLWSGLSGCTTTVAKIPRLKVPAAKMRVPGKNSFQYLFGSNLKTQEESRRTDSKSTAKNRAFEEDFDFTQFVENPQKEQGKTGEIKNSETAKNPDPEPPKTPLSSETQRLIAVFSKDQWTANVELQNWLNKQLRNGEIPSKERLVLSPNNPNAKPKTNHFARFNASSESKVKPGNFIVRDKELSDRGPISLHRWYHGELEKEILSLEEEFQASDMDEIRLQAAKILANAEPQSVIYANAAIFLARLDTPEVKPFLLESLMSKELSIQARCAVLEALGTLSSTTDEDLIKLYGMFCEKTKFSEKDQEASEFRPGQPELTIEVLHSLVQRRSPGSADCFTKALKSELPSIRLAAVEIWRDHPPGESEESVAPGELEKLVVDPVDERIRAAALLALARWNHPRIDRFLLDGIHDTRLNVRLAAVEAMSIASTAESRAILKERTKIPSSVERAKIAAALRKLGENEELFRLVGDKAPEVRKEVALGLTDSNDPKTRELVKTLLEDNSSSVQSGVFEALKNWPEIAVDPILLEQMGSLSRLKREKATQLLARHWSAASQFDYADIRTEVRNAALEELKNQFYAEEKYRDSDSGEFVRNSGGTKNRSSKARNLDRYSLEKGRAAIRMYTHPRATREERSRAWEEMISLKEKFPLVVEYLVFYEKTLIPEDMYRNVLPKTDPLYLALLEYEEGSVSERRSAVREILEDAQQHPLGPLFISRLSALGVHEEDTLALIGLLRIFEYHPGGIADEFAVHFLENPAPEIRRRAATLLGESEDDSMVRYLLPMLNDSSTEVIRASLHSLKNLAAVYFQEDAEVDSRDIRSVVAAIKPVLLRSEVHLQIAAALALNEWGDPGGFETLQRLSHAPEDRTRTVVAQSIAQLRDPGFAEILIPMLDDKRGSVKQAALNSLPQLLEVDHGNPKNLVSVPLQEQIKNWKRWAKTGYYGGFTQN